MKRLSAALLLIVSGCTQSPCRDIIQHNFLYGAHISDNYYQCDKGCCREKNPRDCSCSRKCACWPRHTELVQIVIPPDAPKAPPARTAPAEPAPFTNAPDKKE